MTPEEIGALFVRFAGGDLYPGAISTIMFPQQFHEAAAAIEAATIEKCAEAIDALNDSAGDRASYDNREMYPEETARMHALIDAATAIRAIAKEKS